MSPEKKLLILTCNLKPSKEKIEKVKELISKDIDWNLFLNLIYRNATYPLVYQNFREVLPKEVKTNLEIAMIRLKRHHNKLLKELIHISKLFEKNNIPLIVLKGLPLAKILYGNYNLRSTSDLDLLVKKNNLAKVETLLKKEKYINHYDTDSFGKKRTKSWYLKHDQHLIFYNKKRKTAIEVHWAIKMEDLNFKIQEERYWKKPIKVKIKNETFYTLNKEYLFLHSSLHLIKHYMLLRYIYDVYLLLKKYNFNWNKLYYLSKKYKVSYLIYYVLIKTKKLFNANIPKSSVLKLKKDSSKIKLAILEKLNFSYEDYLNNPIKSRLFSLLLPSKFSVKFNYFKDFLFPPKSKIIQNFNLKENSILFPYYLLEPFRKIVVAFKCIKKRTGKN